MRVGADGERFDGVASFGRRPTFDNGAPLLEVFLFDFKGDLYGAVLDVAFIAFIRDELKFDGIEALVRQMDDDSAKARAALAAAPGAFPRLGDRLIRRRAGQAFGRSNARPVPCPPLCAGKMVGTAQARLCRPGRALRTGARLLEGRPCWHGAS